MFDIKGPLLSEPQSYVTDAKKKKKLTENNNNPLRIDV